jgi:hypothetical protein
LNLIKIFLDISEGRCYTKEHFKLSSFSDLCTIGIVDLGVLIFLFWRGADLVLYSI